MNLVEGGPVEIRAARGVSHDLAYAETIVVPAAVGGYEVVNRGVGRARVVTSSVRLR